MITNLFDEFKLSKLPVIDLLTFDKNKILNDEIISLTDEIAQYIINNKIDISSFMTTSNSHGVKWNPYYGKTNDKLLIRYDKFTNLNDAIKFKDFMKKLFKRKIHIEAQSWGCNPKDIERYFTLKAL